MARRVVVTGLGAISPVGNDVPTMWKNMLDGVNGIETITRFDTSDLKVHIAGLVKDFEPEKYFEKREAKKLDLYCQYAIAAAQQAVDDSGILGKIDENRFGVYIGAGIGGLDTFVKNTVAHDHGGPRKVSPFFIPMMIGNIATGNVAIRFGAKGVSLSVMSACAKRSAERLTVRAFASIAAIVTSSLRLLTTSPATLWLPPLPLRRKLLLRLQSATRRALPRSSARSSLSAPSQLAVAISTPVA